MFLVVDITIDSIGFDCAGYGITSGVAPFSFGLTQSITHYSIYLAPTAPQNYNCNFIMSLNDGTASERADDRHRRREYRRLELEQVIVYLPESESWVPRAPDKRLRSQIPAPAPIQLTGITLSPPSFTTNTSRFRANIAAAGTLPVTVYYTPSGVESETGALDLTYTQVPDNGVTLNGNGIAPTALAVTTVGALPQATQNGRLPDDFGRLPAAQDPTPGRWHPVRRCLPD